MTFRAKPVVKRAHRSPHDSASRRTLYTNLAFGGVILLAIAILGAAAGASWYGDHLAAIARVHGVDITKDQFRERILIENFRFDVAERKVRDAFNGGRLTESQQNQQLQFIAQAREEGQLASIALERLIDGLLQKRLATELGVTVDEAAIDAKLVEESTTPEERHLWIIDVEPETDDGSDEPTTAQRQAAKAAADQALADIRGGKPFEEVARVVSTDPSASQGGDLGWVNRENSLDEPFMAAVFAVDVNVPTDVIEGEDGIYRIGRVSEIEPERVDATYQDQIVADKIPLESYREAVRSDVTREALEKRIVADVVEAATPQRRVQEIYIAEAQSQGPGDQVKVSHILYAPKDDPDGAGALPETDPAWAEAKKAAQAGYDTLKPLIGKPAELEEAFVELARKDSDEPGADTSGGDLPYFVREDVDRGFGDAIFKDGLEKGDLLEPAKSQFGWHVILFEDRRLDPQQRMNGAKLSAEQGEDFGKLAKELSEAPEASENGEIGWVARGQFDKQLEDPIFATAVGEVSDIVTIEGDGFYLYKILEEAVRKPEGNQIKTLTDSAFSNWYSEKKEAADIFRDPSLFTDPTTPELVE
jgi:parvulin-like peptidyl-prolyl isomerase